VNQLAKEPGLPDAPILMPDREFQLVGNLSKNQPRVHDYLKEMNREVLRHYDCFAVGETPGKGPVKLYAEYSIPQNRELQMVFQFHQ
jgi:oligo-1,6-glucosidase